MARRDLGASGYPYELPQLAALGDASWDLRGLVDHVDRRRRTGGQAR